jgi:hypothetical protein
MDEISPLRVIGYAFLTLWIIAILAFGILFLNGQLYPLWLSIQRQSVEQSKSFTDSNNTMLATYMLEYSRLDTKRATAGENTALVNTYKAQQNAILGKMCLEISTMTKNTVNPDVLRFLNSNGGCGQ